MDLELIARKDLLMDGPWARRRSRLKEKRNQIGVLDVLPWRDHKMTLQRFHNVTADVDEGQLRQAMTVALASEIPRDPEGYRRFYARVIDALPEPAESRPVLATPELVPA